MRDNKKTKNIKVRDLKPKKDAKGGFNYQSPTSPNSPKGPNQVTGPGTGNT